MGFIFEISEDAASGGTFVGLGALGAGAMVTAEVWGSWFVGLLTWLSILNTKFAMSHAHSLSTPGIFLATAGQVFVT